MLQQESEEVRQLQRRVAELEFSATSAGITEEEVDSLRAKVQDAALRMDDAEWRCKDSERRQKQLEAELLVSKSGGSAADGAEVSALRNNVSSLERELAAEREEKSRMAEQAQTEKEMFIGIATGLETEIKETKAAMEQMMQAYPNIQQPQ